jgi:hypothetical protein
VYTYHKPFTVGAFSGFLGHPPPCLVPTVRRMIAQKKSMSR